MSGPSASGHQASAWGLHAGTRGLLSRHALCQGVTDRAAQAEWEGDPKSMLAPHGRPAGPLLPGYTSAVEEAVDP